MEEKKIPTVQETLSRIQKELKAPKGQRNSFGNYNYRSCEDILEAVKPLLGTASITLSDEIVCIGAEPTLVGEVEHEYTDKNKDKKVISTKEIVSGYRFYIKATAIISENGESISVTSFARESLDKKGMDLAQITGATSSYARKYALNGLLLIDDTRDADSTNTHGKDSKSGVKYDKKGIVVPESVDQSEDPFNM